MWRLVTGRADTHDPSKVDIKYVRTCGAVGHAAGKRAGYVVVDGKEVYAFLVGIGETRLKLSPEVTHVPLEAPLVSLPGASAHLIAKEVASTSSMLHFYAVDDDMKQVVMRMPTPSLGRMLMDSDDLAAAVWTMFEFLQKKVLGEKKMVAPSALQGPQSPLVMINKATAAVLAPWCTLKQSENSRWSGTLTEATRVLGPDLMTTEMKKWAWRAAYVYMLDSILQELRKARIDGTDSRMQIVWSVLGATKGEPLLSKELLPAVLAKSGEWPMVLGTGSVSKAPDDTDTIVDTFDDMTAKVHVARGTMTVTNIRPGDFDPARAPQVPEHLAALKLVKTSEENANPMQFRFQCPANTVVPTWVDHSLGCLPQWCTAEDHIRTGVQYLRELTRKGQGLAHMPQHPFGLTWPQRLPEAPPTPKPDAPSPAEPEVPPPAKPDAPPPAGFAWQAVLLAPHLLRPISPTDEPLSPNLAAWVGLGRDVQQAFAEAGLLEDTLSSTWLALATSFIYTVKGSSATPAALRTILNPMSCVGSSGRLVAMDTTLVPSTVPPKIVLKCLEGLEGELRQLWVVGVQTSFTSVIPTPPEYYALPVGPDLHRPVRVLHTEVVPGDIAGNLCLAVQLSLPSWNLLKPRVPPYLLRHLAKLLSLHDTPKPGQKKATITALSPLPWQQLWKDNCTQFDKFLNALATWADTVASKGIRPCVMDAHTCIPLIREKGEVVLFFMHGLVQKLAVERHQYPLKSLMPSFAQFVAGIPEESNMGVLQQALATDSGQEVTMPTGQVGSVMTFLKVLTAIVHHVYTFQAHLGDAYRTLAICCCNRIAETLLKLMRSDRHEKLDADETRGVWVHPAPAVVAEPEPAAEPVPAAEPAAEPVRAAEPAAEPAAVRAAERETEVQAVPAAESSALAAEGVVGAPVEDTAAEQGPPSPPQPKSALQTFAQQYASSLTALPADKAPEPEQPKSWWSSLTGAFRSPSPVPSEPTSPGRQSWSFWSSPSPSPTPPPAPSEPTSPGRQPWSLWSSVTSAAKSAVSRGLSPVQPLRRAASRATRAASWWLQPRASAQGTPNGLGNTASQQQSPRSGRSRRRRRGSAFVRMTTRLRR